MAFKKRTTTAKTKTGSPTFDRDRFSPKGESQRPTPIARPEAGAIAGDVVDGLFHKLLSPGCWMTICYVGAGLCLVTSAYGYSRIILPGMATILPVSLALPIGSALTALAAGLVQMIEILPDLEEIFPDIAQRIAFKLKLEPVVQPTPDRHSATLLKSLNEKNKKQLEKLYERFVPLKWLAYLFEFVGSFWAFNLFVAGVLNVPGLVGAAIAVAGFEICVRFASKFRSMRLTRRQSRLYREHRKDLTRDSEKDLFPNKFQQPKTGDDSAA